MTDHARSWHHLVALLAEHGVVPDALYWIPESGALPGFWCLSVSDDAEVVALSTVEPTERVLSVGRLLHGRTSVLGVTVLVDSRPTPVTTTEAA